MALARQLVAISGPDRGKIFPLERRETIVGRDVSAHIILSDPEASRQHCKITNKGRKTGLRDLDSTNGTQVNGRAVQETWLQTGDRIQIGDSVFELGLAGESSRHRKAPANQLVSQIVKARKSALIGGWRWETRVLAVVLGLVLMALLLVTVPLIRAQTSLQEQDAIRRASVLVTALALANRHAVASGEEMLVDISGVEQASEVVKAFIYDAQGRILAPVSLLHQKASDPLTKKALASRELSVAKTGEDRLDLAMPIKVFRPARGEHQKIGTARLIYSTADASTLGGRMWGKLLFSLLLLLAAGISAWLVIISFTKRTLLSLRDQCEQAIKGSREDVQPSIAFPALAALAASINRCLSKKDGVKAAPAAPPEAEPAPLPPAEAASASVSGQAPAWENSEELSLNERNLVIHASEGLLQLLGQAEPPLEGKHLLHIIKDQQLLTQCLRIMEQAAAQPGLWCVQENPSSGGLPGQLAALMQDSQTRLVFNTGRPEGSGLS